MSEALATPRKKLIELLEFYNEMLQNPGTYSYRELEKIREEIEEAREKRLDTIWMAYFKERKQDNETTSTNSQTNSP